MSCFSVNLETAESKAYSIQSQTVCLCPLSSKAISYGFRSVSLLGTFRSFEEAACALAAGVELVLELL